MTAPNNNRSSYLEESDFGFQSTAPSGLAPSYHSQVHASTPLPLSNVSYPHSSSSHSSGVLVPLAEERAGGEPGSTDPSSYNALNPSTRHDWQETESLAPGDSASMYGRSEVSQHRPAQQSIAGLSYVDEAGDYYRDPNWKPVGDGYGSERDDGRQGLVAGAAAMAGHRGVGDGDDEEDGRGKRVSFNNMQYANAAPPPFVPTRMQRVLESVGLGGGKYPLEQRIENKRRGIGRQRRPWAVWTLSLVMICVMAYELAKSQQLSGSPISTKPTFNWMIGPSPAVLVNIGARFVPCMKSVEALPLSYAVTCFNTTTSSVSAADACTIAEWCGLALTDKPSQTWRFITPIFMHAGIVHILLNVLVLMLAGGQLEKELGWFCFLIIFFAGGIFGFELGGNFALPGIPSVGASGAIFAVNAVTFVDLIEHWQFEQRPKTKLFMLIIELLIMIGMGFIPTLIDNFSHLGGFMMGLLLGTILYPTISTTKLHRTLAIIFKVIALPLIVLAFVLATKNFYSDDPSAACSWCRYLSCLPIAMTNYCKGTGFTQTSSTTSTTRRMLGLVSEL